MNATYALAQWLRRLSGDHDELHGSQRQIDAEQPVELTDAEIQEGLSL